MEQLEPGWLSLELSSVETEIALWQEGLRESFLAATAAEHDDGTAADNSSDAPAV